MPVIDFSRQPISGFSRGFSEGTRLGQQQKQFDASTFQRDREFAANARQAEKVQVALDAYRERTLRLDAERLAEQRTRTRQQERFQTSSLERLTQQDAATATFREATLEQGAEKIKVQREGDDLTRDLNPMIDFTDPLTGETMKVKSSSVLGFYTSLGLGSGGGFDLKNLSLSELDQVEKINTEIGYSFDFVTKISKWSNAGEKLAREIAFDKIRRAREAQKEADERERMGQLLEGESFQPLRSHQDSRSRFPLESGRRPF